MSQMDKVLQAGLASGFSATEGYHSATPEFVSPDYDNNKDLTPSDYVPSADRKIRYRGRSGDVHAASWCIGAWPWGDFGTRNWKEGKLAMLKKAWEIVGGGESERIAAGLFKSMERTDFVIETKSSGIPVDPTTWVHWETAPYKRLKDSLKRIELEFVDIQIVDN
ncbi:hypothetical protein DOTSEDRAFT_27208 [Dothistroma septosporum NZE10]|uniref:NADP-dependent oxidoreductase domain-containing protein n=1 Tax=Dothistroma septosporum (strain NZE10 / CBS 128990) TaxID=675120 RepID=N1PDY5_DOTSN|nr:hypothetical protein DOTSEDRAFT_27208 [Dothistroma septosporum NZE10]